jgi:hypothetical protein
MKKNKISLSYKTSVVNTDGSTFTLALPYQRKNVFLINDFLTNPLYKSPFKVSKKINKLKEKNKHLNFNFNKLI